VRVTVRVLVAVGTAVFVAVFVPLTVFVVVTVFVVATVFVAYAVFVVAKVFVAYAVFVVATVFVAYTVFDGNAVAYDVFAAYAVDVARGPASAVVDEPTIDVTPNAPAISRAIVSTTNQGWLPESRLFMLFRRQD
jgi:hypothetical protein